MTSELVIDVQQKQISIALLEDQKLVEYQYEPRSASFAVGNIYMAKVRKLMPGLNACFVDVGHERDAFLHYLDLGNQFSSYEKYLKQVQSDRKRSFPFSKASRLPDLPKDGSVQTTLGLGQEVLVQIVKEPISTKGPRLTGEISFAGRYLVLIPFNDKVTVSSKIKSGEERARLKQLIHSIKPRNCGVIVRTVAEGRRVAELDAELKILNKRWEETIQKVQEIQQRPQLVYEETGRAVALLRDLFNQTYESIHVNDEDVFNEVKSYVSLIAPEKANIVKLYTGKVPIFDNYNVTKQLKSGFGKIVSFKHGAYLVIEHTEALHVVDVNSGVRTRSAEGQEANALEVNLGRARGDSRSRRRTGPPTATARHGWHHRRRFHRHEPARRPPDALRADVQEHGAGPRPPQHSAAVEIRTDADYAPARSSRHRCQCRRNLSDLFWKRNHQVESPFHRAIREQN